jgi:hypothetical protein
MSDTTGLIGGDENEYGYNPSKGVAIGFIVLFSLSTCMYFCLFLSPLVLFLHS